MVQANEVEESAVLGSSINPRQLISEVDLDLLNTYSSPLKLTGNSEAGLLCFGKGADLQCLVDENIFGRLRQPLGIKSIQFDCPATQVALEQVGKLPELPELVCNDGIVRVWKGANTTETMVSICPDELSAIKGLKSLTLNYKSYSTLEDDFFAPLKVMKGLHSLSLGIPVLCGPSVRFLAWTKDLRSLTVDGGLKELPGLAILGSYLSKLKHLSLIDVQLSTEDLKSLLLVNRQRIETLELASDCFVKEQTLRCLRGCDALESLTISGSSVKRPSSSKLKLADSSLTNLVASSSLKLLEINVPIDIVDHAMVFSTLLETCPGIDIRIGDTIRFKQGESMQL